MTTTKEKKSKLADTTAVILSIAPHAVNAAIFLGVAAWVLIHTIISEPVSDISWAFPAVLCSVPFLTIGVIAFAVYGIKWAGKEEQPRDANGRFVAVNGKKKRDLWLRVDKAAVKQQIEEDSE